MLSRRRPRNVPRLRSSTQADQQSAGVRVPVRRAQPHKRRHQHHPARVRYACGERLHLGRGADEFQIVAQPLHHSAADEDAAFERVLQAMLRAGRQRGNQPVLRAHEARPVAVALRVPMFCSRKQPVP